MHAVVSTPISLKPTPVNRVKSAFAAVCAAAVAFTGTGALAAVQAPEAAAQTAPSTSDAPAIIWEECPEQVNIDSAQCGHIEVPAYYSAPERGNISVGFVRVPAAQPAAKRGTLFGNPGGPSGDAYSYFGNDSVAWPEGIVNEWDRVAVQPRGLPGSTPVVCDQPGGTVLDSMVNVGAYIRNSCEKSTPGYTNSITTENTARDWEMVRRALGEDRISIMGLSYGTYLGSVYATLYPQNTDRVVLDSAMAPSLMWNGILASQQSAYESALDDFFSYVADNNDRYHMGTTPLQVYERWSYKVASEAGVRPTVLPPDAEIGDLPPGLEFAGQPGADIMTATGELRVQAEHLRDKAMRPEAVQASSPTLAVTRVLVPMAAEWETLAKHISNVEPIDFGSGQSEEDVRKTQLTMAQSQNMQNLILCNENQFPANYSLIPTYLWANFVTADPFTVYNALYASGAACNGRGPVTTPVKISGANLATRPLQISATQDPQTPYKYHGEMASAMNAQVLTVHGPGHGHVAMGNKAVDDIVVDYLRTGNVSTHDVPGLH